MKKSKVSDPEKWPSAFDVLHFASPEDAAKAQSLLYEMAAENVALRSKVTTERELQSPSVKFSVKEIAWLCNLYVALEKWRNTIFVDTNPIEPTHAEMAVVNRALRETWDRYKKETTHKSIGGIDTQWVTEKIKDLDLPDYFMHDAPCPCTQLPHTCGAPVPTVGQEELARQIYGMAHRRINRRHKVAQIAERLREIMANCSKPSTTDKDYVISDGTMYPRGKRGL